MQNDGRNDDGDKGVGIEPPAELCQPDEERRSDDTYIAHSVPKNVQEDARHVQVVTFALPFAFIISRMDMVTV